MPAAPAIGAAMALPSIPIGTSAAPRTRWYRLGLVSTLGAGAFSAPGIWLSKVLGVAKNLMMSVGA